MQHITHSQQFTRAFLESLFKEADACRIQHETPLQGKIAATLFYEPSTRTRFSFEAAMLRLGGSVISTENAKEYSSAAKGETLEDSIRTIGCYADVIVLRHGEEGASERAAAVSSVPVINAGDGAGQHPTQALLDLYSIQRERGTIDDTRIVLMGDLKYGRTIHSLLYLLAKFDDITIDLVSPRALGIPQDIRAYLDREKVRYTEHDTQTEVLSTCDVVYQTRIQKERFEDTAAYERLKDSFIIDTNTVALLHDKAIILHPLPRVNEISPAVDSNPKAAYFRQVENGLYVRMALLKHVLGK